MNIEIDVPDNATDAEILVIVREAVAFANEMHIKLGGHGLKVDAVSVTGDPIDETRRSVIETRHNAQDAAYREGQQ